MQPNIWSSCLQEELHHSMWQRLAPDIEPDSYLMSQNGRGLDPVGTEVVFVKEGLVHP